MSFIHDLNPKVILFAGRLSDSRKGLPLFLEAIKILTTLSSLPQFIVWIVGGSRREVELVLTLVDSMSCLQQLRSDGRMQLWSRVENTALAEIYSRAYVTVVPSHREEFGIVAVEAMMCGCPVAGAKTDGLQDIIVDGQTGTLFESDDALGLAATLSGYLRNPYQRNLHGEQGRRRAERLFANPSSLARVAALYHCDSATPRARPDKWEIDLDKVVDDERKLRVKRVLRIESLSIVRIDKGQHPVFRVEGSGRRRFAKFFTQRSSLQASLFPTSQLTAARGALIGFSREMYNRENPLAPRIEFHEEVDEPLVISDWLEPFAVVTTESLDDVVADAFRRCQSHLPLHECAELDAYVDALANVASHKDTSSLNQFDMASAKLNSRMTRGEFLQCRTHPQVELIRFQLLISQHTWPLPLEFESRVDQAISLLLRKQEIINTTPTLAHGDPKPEHLLNDSNDIRIADFEHSRYAAGPCDLALWFGFTGIRGRLEANAANICDRIWKQCSVWEDRYLCLCWVVSESIFYAIHRFTRGDRRELQVTRSFLRDLPFALLNRD